MFNYSAMGALAVLIVLWAVLLFDTANILHHMSEVLHMFERALKSDGS